MCEVLSGLDLALFKAKREKKILIYQDYGNNYDISSTYDNFYFHKFENIKSFCEVIFEIVSNISENNDSVKYEFPDHFSNENFYILIDGWKNIYVTNFPKDIDIFEYEKVIEEYFKNKLD